MIQSVQRAAQILAVLGSGTPRLGVTEIADRTGLAKPTVHGLLRTLEAHDLVAQDPDTGKYSLGPGVLQLGNAYLDGSDLRARSLRWAESLAQRAGEADGVVAGAIGVVGAADRLLNQRSTEELVRAVQEAARAISRDLGAGRGGLALSALS